jgi:hypothetical protein
LRILLSDIQGLRLTCQHKRKQEECGAVVEIPVKHLDSIALSIECPVCGNQIRRGSEDVRYDHFGRFIEALRALRSTEQVHVALLVSSDEG